MLLLLLFLQNLIPALRTNAGKAFQAKVMGDPTSDGTGDYAPGSYIALTADDTAPAAGSTTLTGEIGSGTLARAVAAFAYNSGSGSYTLVKTFTSDQSVTVNKIGVFNDPAAGTLIFETLLDAPAVLQPGDTLQITETVTL